jgi:putative ABC transport system permease protein
VRILALKTWRDMLAHKGQFAALILLVVLGIASYVAFVEAYRNLGASADYAYSRLRFADFSISVIGAPNGIVHKVEAVPGVAAAEGRLIVDAGMDVDAGRQGTVRVVGLPPDRRPSVNDLLVESGRYLQPDDLEAGLIHSKFAADNDRSVGDTVRLRTGDQTHDIRIVGVAASPEYLFPVRSKNDIPDLGGFTVLFMPQHEVERLFGRVNEISDVAVRVRPGVDADRVMDRVEAVLKPYRIVATTPAAEQASNYFLMEEIDQNRVLASIMPTLILIISALSLAIALARLVQSQRGQIGLAKALGYTDGQVLFHYLLFSLAVGIIGSLVGFVVGHFLSMLITAEYITMLGVPYLRAHAYPDVVATAVVMSAVSCVIAGLVPAWASARMTPARAMHPDPNLALRGGTKPVVERVLGRWMPATFMLRIPVRNVFRAKRRSLYTIVGIAFAVLLTLATSAFYDSVESLLYDTYPSVERWDVSGYFEGHVTPGQIRDMERWDGVRRVQSALVIPVTLHAGTRSYVGALTAMDPGADFHGFEIVEGSSPDEAASAGGLVLPRLVAQKLGVSLGDLVSVKTPYLSKRVSVPVQSLSEESIGQPVYTGINRGAELVGASRAVYNAVYLDVDPRFATAARERLFDIPGAAQVLVKDSLLVMLREMMSFTYYFFGVILAFGFAMAFVVIYNTFTANVIERTREIATMRTIGEDTRHLAIMVTIENLLLAVVGIPLGIWLGLATARAVLASMSSEQFSLRIIAEPSTVIWVSLSVIVVLLISEIPPIRRIAHLDLAEATKVME